MGKLSLVTECEVTLLARADEIEMGGKVIEALPNTSFTVELDNGHKISTVVSGRIRKHRVRILAGDIVTVAISPSDVTKGRIIFRER